MAVLILIILLCAFFVSLYKFSTSTFNFWKSLNVAGPEPTAFFGNFLRVALKKDYRSTVTADIYEKYPKEKVVGFYRLRTPVLLIRDLDVIKQILIKDFDNFQHRGIEFSKEGVGANLFHSDGDTWNVLRKKLSPLFTSSKLKGMFYLIEDRAREFVKYVDGIIAEGKDVEISDLTSKYTAEVIGACAFGVNIDAFNDKFNKHLDIGNKHMTPTLRLTMEMLIPGLLKTLNVDMFSREVRDHYRNLVRTVLREREGKPKTRRDFMDLMIEMKEKGTVTGNRVRSTEEVDLEITEQMLTAQAFIFFGAGFETSAGTMTQMLYELAIHPDIQDKVVEEIQATLKAQDGRVTYDSVAEMPYLEMVFSETLRKYPVIDITRKAVHDYKIPGTDITVPKGTNILIPTLGIHRDAAYYPNPDRFDPERFTPENIQRRHPCAWLPFGEGPRECIGTRFARLQAKTGIVHFLSRFRVEPSERTNTKPTFEPRRFTLLVQGGTWLAVSRR